MEDRLHERCSIDMLSSGIMVYLAERPAGRSDKAGINVNVECYSAWPRLELKTVISLRFYCGDAAVE